MRGRYWVLIGGIAVLALVAAGGYWFARIHARTDAQTVQGKVSAASPGATAVRCVSAKSNGSRWVCGVVYHAATECVVGKASMTGSITTVPGKGNCADQPALKAMVPEASAAGVAADVTLKTGGAVGLRCVRLKSAKHAQKWICGRSRASTDCRVVRVVPWTAFDPQASTRCSKPPFTPRERHNRHPKSRVT